MLKKISTLIRVCCLVGMMVWGHSICAQNEDAARSDSLAGGQVSGQHPRAFVMGSINGNSILPLMPQYLAMQESLKSLRDQYEAEAGMLADVKAELQEAVATVAQQKGVSIVYDLDNGSVPYIMSGMAVDLNAVVMQYLGIDPKAASAPSMVK